MPGSHARDPFLDKIVTIVDQCHGNLVQVQSLVNRTVDKLAINVSIPINTPVAPPFVPQGVLSVEPAKRELIVGQLQHQIAGAEVPAAAARAPIPTAATVHVQAAHSEPVRHTSTDLTYFPFNGH